MTIALNAKRILVVCPDIFLRQSRALLLQHEGYRVSSVATDDEALEALSINSFDLVLLGRSQLQSRESSAQRIRQNYPTQLLLEIQPLEYDERIYPFQTVSSEPKRVIDAVHRLLNDNA